MAAEIKIGGTNYNIFCPENEVKDLQKIGANLNQKFHQIADEIKNYDEKTILVYLALTLEIEVQKLTQEIKKSPEIENDLYDAVSENIENISEIIAALTKKIAHY